MVAPTCWSCKRSAPEVRFYTYATGKRKGFLMKPCQDCRVKARKAWVERVRATEPKRFALYRKEEALKRHYGLTLEQWQARIDAQEGRCACCGTTEPGGKGFQVDHNHQTGALRGMLCTQCNVDVGRVETRLDLILAYLAKHPSALEAAS